MLKQRVLAGVLLSFCLAFTRSTGGLLEVGEVLPPEFYGNCCSTYTTSNNLQRKGGRNGGPGSSAASDNFSSAKKKRNLSKGPEIGGRLYVYKLFFGL